MNIPETIKFIKQEDIKQWKPLNENDYLIGKVIDLKSTKFGISYKVVGDSRIGDTNSSGILWTPPQTKIIELMSKAQIGDYCKIYYKGNKDIGKGNPLEMYSIEIGFSNIND